MKATIKWATPDADAQILYIARVSNPDNQSSTDTKLLGYLMKHAHVSPFEMANACIEIETTRDIGRQLLRHRSMSFQEFSGRYQSYDKLPESPLRECRLQDTKNRQNSLEVNDNDLAMWWRDAQSTVIYKANALYTEAISKGIAKEQARALLPEGLTASRMYANATLRSWIHYLQSRLDPSTQKEHRELAQAILAALRTVAPITMNAFFPDDKSENPDNKTLPPRKKPPKAQVNAPKTGAPAWVKKLKEKQ